MAQKNNFSIRNVQLLALFLLAAIFLSLLYIPYLGSPPLIDEQYLFDFLHSLSSSNASIAQSLYDFKGLESTDTFSIVSVTILNAISNFSVKAIRNLGLVFHISNVILIYLVMVEALKPSAKLLIGTDRINWFPILIAACFGVYPITTEAIFWSGSLAYTSGLCFLLTSFLFYFKAKEKKSWKLIIAGALIYLCALFSDSSLWSASFILVALELTRNFLGPNKIETVATKSEIASTEDIEDAVDKLLESEIKGKKTKETLSLKPENVKEKDNEESVFDTLLPALPYLAIGAILPLGGLPHYGTEQLNQEMIIQASDWITAFKVFWFPINESITIGYNKQYSFLYILYAIGLVAAPIAFWKSRSFRQHFVLMLVWLLMAIVPHLHHIINNSTMTGARWFYHASVPICAITVLYFGSANFFDFKLFQNRKTLISILTTGFSVILVLILTGFMFTKTRSQLRAYKTSAQLVHDLRFSIKSVCAKERKDFLLVRNIPKSASVSPQTDPFNIILFDGSTQLIRAPRVVGGKIKDLFKENKFQNRTYFYEHNTKSLYPIDFGLVGEDTINKLSGVDIKERVVPPIHFLNTTSYDQESKCIKVFSNKKAGPVLTISANGFSPLGGDFIYLDAKIDTPDSNPKDIELAWMTTWGKDLERRDRLSSAKTYSNDNKFNRYYFPVRSTAWASNGKIQKLSILFPESATVLVKEFGQIDKEDLIPSLTLTNSTPVNGQFYSQGQFTYPNDQTLGLNTVFGPGKDIEFRYDAKNVTGASKVICEVGRLGKFFENPNGFKLSKHNLKVLKLSHLEGKIIVKSKILGKNGIYSFRIFATDENNKIIGNSSDEVCCLVDSSLEIAKK